MSVIGPLRTPGAAEEEMVVVVLVEEEREKDEAVEKEEEEANVHVQAVTPSQLTFPFAFCPFLLFLVLPHLPEPLNLTRPCHHIFLPLCPPAQLASPYGIYLPLPSSSQTLTSTTTYLLYVTAASPYHALLLHTKPLLSATSPHRHSVTPSRHILP